MTAAKALLSESQGEASAYARERQAAKAQVAQEKMQQRRKPARKRRPGRSDLTPAAQSCLTGSKELPKNGSRDMSGGNGGGEVPQTYQEALPSESRRSMSPWPTWKTRA